MFKEADAYDAVYNWFNVLKAKGHYVIGYTIMPNHVHCMIAFTETGQSIGTIVGNGKRFMVYNIINILTAKNMANLLGQLQAARNFKEIKEGKLYTCLCLLLIENLVIAIIL